MISPYPQQLIVLWVYSGLRFYAPFNIYSSCGYGFTWTSCLVRNAEYENPNISAPYINASFKDLLTMAIRSAS